ncbi:MAG: hypothetical protein IRZ21_04455 [Thermoleophilaceae bacterium]|nr:hypothetical protein [Thermoleophilaceae bacterium]
MRTTLGASALIAALTLSGCGDSHSGPRSAVASAYRDWVRQAVAFNSVKRGCQGAITPRGDLSGACLARALRRFHRQTEITLVLLARAMVASPGCAQAAEDAERTLIATRSIYDENVRAWRAVFRALDRRRAPRGEPPSLFDDRSQALAARLERTWESDVSRLGRACPDPPAPADADGQ